MKFSLSQIIAALESLRVIDGDKASAIRALNEARTLVNEAVAQLDGLTVQGREAVDLLLGCMMALEALTGGETNA